MSTSHSMGVLGMGTYGVSMPFTPPPIHGFHLTPRIRRAMGLANNTSTTSKPRQPSSRATTTNTETFAVANSSDNRPGTKATWKTASSCSPISRTTETVHVLQQTLRPGRGGGGCGLLGKKASVPRVFSLISFILVSVWTAADRRAVFRDHWMWWQSRVWAGPGMASRAPS